MEMILSDPIANPMVLHVDAFGALSLDSVGGDAFCALVVAYHDSGWLMIAQRMERVSNPFTFLSIEEQRSIFRFDR